MRQVYCCQIKGYTVTLNGNRLSGKTFEVKNYIKAYFDGKWDADRKEWIVNVGKVMDIASRAGSYTQIVDGEITPVKANGTTATNGWCNKCHSYCWGDCEAN